MSELRAEAINLIEKVPEENLTKLFALIKNFVERIKI